MLDQGDVWGTVDPEQGHLEERRHRPLPPYRWQASAPPILLPGAPWRGLIPFFPKAGDQVSQLIYRLHERVGVQAGC